MLTEYVLGLVIIPASSIMTINAIIYAVTLVSFFKRNPIGKLKVKYMKVFCLKLNFSVINYRVKALIAFLYYNFIIYSIYIV